MGKWIHGSMDVQYDHCKGNKDGIIIKVCFGLSSDTQESQEVCRDMGVCGVCAHIYF